MQNLQPFKKIFFALITLLTITFGHEFDYAPRVFLAIFTWVILNWLFSTTPLFVTGIIGVCASILLGVSDIKLALSSFASPTVFLFLGGFLFARAMEKMGLDRRLSQYILKIPYFSKNSSRNLLGIILVTAFLSMWISNTATTAMMIPLTLGLFQDINIADRKIKSSILLSVAYAATIGGIVTPIGSPPNIITIGFLKSLANVEINFLSWILMTLPFAVILLTFLYRQTKKLIPEGKLIGPEKNKLEVETFTKVEKIFLFVFLTLILCWLTPSVFSIILADNAGINQYLKSHFHPGVVALMFASLLFVIPKSENETILSAHDIKQIDWPSLLLFGSGLSLGKILFSTGLAAEFGTVFNSLFGDIHFSIILIGIIALTVFFTELASNTASANILIPIIIASSMSANMSPTLPALALGISCNLAFMLPVATPPNTIIYGTGLIKMKEMVCKGFMFNVISIVLLALIFGALTLFSV